MKLGLCLLATILACANAVYPNVCAGLCGDDFVPDPNHCKAYYACVDEVAYLLTCPDGYTFDAEARICREGSVASCASNPPDPCENATNGRLSFPDNCKLYYQCSNKIGNLQVCTGLNAFRPETGQCEPIENVAACGDICRARLSTNALLAGNPHFRPKFHA